MKTGIATSIKIFIMLSAVSTSIYAQKPNCDSNKCFVPKKINIQFAGNIGMLSIGPSWSFANGIIEMTPSFGYAPAKTNGRDIYITTVKFNYSPKLIFHLTKNTLLKPLAIGAVFSYTFKDKINKGQETENYPDVYYWKNIKYRMGLFYQLEFFAKINNKRIDGIGFYLEASWWDVYLVSKFDHNNNSYLSLWDITTLGLGTKICF